MNKKKLIALAIPLALAACSGRSGAEKAVRESLTDPESAKFGEFYFNGKTGRACLTVNAKNSFGGYVGDKQARLRKDTEGWHYEYSFGDTSEECRARHADVPDPYKHSSGAKPGMTVGERNRLFREMTH